MDSRAAEVRAEPHAVQAETLHQVVHVANHDLERGVWLVVTITPQARDLEIESEHPVRVADGVELVVGEVMASVSVVFG